MRSSSPLSLSASFRETHPRREEVEEREGQRRLAGWGVDVQALCAEVGALVGRCDPALWLQRREMADETFGGVLLVALALVQVSDKLDTER